MNQVTEIKPDGSITSDYDANNSGNNLSVVDFIWMFILTEKHQILFIHQEQPILEIMVMVKQIMVILLETGITMKRMASYMTPLVSLI